MHTNEDIQTDMRELFKLGVITAAAYQIGCDNLKLVDDTMRETMKVADLADFCLMSGDNREG